MNKNNPTITEDIRWKQRFHNFQNSLLLLESAVKTDKKLDILQQAGVIHFFEMCFELSWNLLKDYLEYIGYKDINSPRSAIKEAFAAGLITDGHAWMELLKDRNMTSHIYNEETSQQIFNRICNQSYPLFKQLQEFFVIKYNTQETDLK
jgi:nucleotidyltransferase substrate binding protein (TIGR01987 family)